MTADQLSLFTLPAKLIHHIISLMTFDDVKVFRTLNKRANAFVECTFSFDVDGERGRNPGAVKVKEALEYFRGDTITYLLVTERCTTNQI